MSQSFILCQSISYKNHDVPRTIRREARVKEFTRTKIIFFLTVSLSHLTDYTGKEGLLEF